MIFRRLAVLFVLCTTWTARAVPIYTVTEIGVPGGSHAALNNHGDVAGTDSSGFFIYSGGVLSRPVMSVDSYPMYNFWPRQINDLGQILGSGTYQVHPEPGGAVDALYLYAGGNLAKLREVNESYDLRTAGMNNQGAVVAATGVDIRGGFTEFGDYILGFTKTPPVHVPAAVNNRGMVVGFDKNFEPVSSVNGKLAHLTRLAGEAGKGKGWIRMTTVNDSGEIIGTFTPPSPRNPTPGNNTGGGETGAGAQAFTYVNGKYTRFDSVLGAPDSSAATAINNHGQVIGDAVGGPDAGQHRYPFIYENGTVTNLQTRFLGGAYLEEITGINDSGQLSGLVKQGYAEYVALLTPGPDVLISGPAQISTTASRRVIRGISTGGATVIRYRVSLGHHHAAGPIKTAKGVAHWHFTAPLRIGTNWIEIYANGPGGGYTELRVVRRD